MIPVQTIAVVENTANVSRVIEPVIDRELGQTLHITSAKSCLSGTDHSLYMVDLMLEDADGLSLIEDLHLKKSQTPIIAFMDSKNLDELGMEEHGLRKMVLDAGASALFLTPFNLGELAQTIQRMLAQPLPENNKSTAKQSAKSSAVA